MRSKEVSTSKVDQGCFALRGSHVELFLIRIVNTGIQEGMRRARDPKTNSGYKTLIYYSAQAN